MVHDLDLKHLYLMLGNNVRGNKWNEIINELCTNYGIKLLYIYTKKFRPYRCDKYMLSPFYSY